MQDLTISIYPATYQIMSVGWSQCDDGYTEDGGECYYKDDLSVLASLIDLNDLDG